MYNINNPSIGLDHDNYIGSLKQINSSKKNWIDFYLIKIFRCKWKFFYNCFFNIIEQEKITFFGKQTSLAFIF